MFGKFFTKHNTITILPHPTLCPSGEVVRAVKGKSIAETLVDQGVDIGHSCQFQCSCTTCHIYLMDGAQYISPMSDEEKNVVKNANRHANWSRLSCECIYNGEGDVIIEIVD